jgi:hypothetical protein
MEILSAIDRSVNKSQNGSFFRAADFILQRLMPLDRDWL